MNYYTFSNKIHYAHSKELSLEPTRHSTKFENVKRFTAGLILFTISFFVPKKCICQTLVQLPLSGFHPAILEGQTALIFDNGGQNINYSNNVDSYVYITATPGQIITITGSYETESNADYISIYSGDGTQGPQHVTLSGTSNWYSYSGVVGEGLTIRFKADAATNLSGFQFLVTHSTSLSPISIPSTGNNQVSCGSNTLLLDDGGRNSTYSSSVDGFTVLKSSPTSQIRLMVFFCTEYNTDFIRIYSGEGTGGPLLYQCSGNMNQYSGPTSSYIDFTGAVGQSLTVAFYSNGSIEDAGFEIAVMYVQPCCVPPTLYYVEGDGSICLGEEASITLSNSDFGVDYQLKRDGSYLGSVVSGTGMPISFGDYSVEGTYTVDAIATGPFCSIVKAMIDSVQISVTQPLEPAVLITKSPNVKICIGTTVTFTGNPTNGGNSPVYQWKVNDINVGTDSSKYVTSTLKNDDKITCELVSSISSCLIHSSVISNEITMNIPVAGSSLSGTASAACIVNGHEWVYFYSNMGYLLGAINARGNDLGSVEMSTYKRPHQVMHDCDEPTNLYLKKAYMGRSWVMKSSSYPTGMNFPSSVRVRLPYRDTDLVTFNIHADTATIGNPNDGGHEAPATHFNLMLTKISGANEDGVISNADCTSEMRKIYINEGTGSNIQSIANTHYLDYDVEQFSEFFLHKDATLSPLSVSLTSFSATCGDNVTLYWTTASEYNSSSFVVEKSRDGQNWFFVGEQTAAGNSNQKIQYSQQDNDVWIGTIYYRLRQFDLNDIKHLYGPISNFCNGNGKEWNIYPNLNPYT